MKKQLGVLLLGCMLTIGSFTAVQAADAPTSIKADVIEYNTKTGITTAKGNVVISQQDGQATAAAAEYNTKDKTGRLTGGVAATKDDARINCDTLVLNDENHTTAIGNAVMKKQDKTLRAAQVEYYKDRNFMETVGSWGELALDDGSVLTAGYINYDGRVGYATAENNVQIVSNARNLTASADKAVYDMNRQGTIELTGNATATQNGNTISGNQLRIVNENNIAEASGNVKMVYIPKTQPAANKG